MAGDAEKRTPTTFLFVNKNARSAVLTRSLTSERSHILRHVRNQRPTSKSKKEQCEAPKYASQISCVPAEDFASFDDQDSHSREDQENDDHPFDRPVALRHTSTSRKSSGNMSHCPCTLQLNLPFHSREIIRRLPQFSHACSTSHVSIPRQVGTKKLLSYLGQSILVHLANITFLAESFAPGNLASTERWLPDLDKHEKGWTSCANNELVVYSSLAKEVSCLAWANGRLNESDSDYWIGRTIYAVRTHISLTAAAKKRFMMFSILTLALVQLWKSVPHMWLADTGEVNEEQLRICKLHLKALLTLCQEGAENITQQSFLLDRIILVDKYVATYDLSEPIFPPTWDPSATPPFLSNSLGEDKNLLKLGTGFEKFTALSHGLQQILRDITDFCAIAHTAWKSTEAHSASAQNWLYRRFQALHWHLLLYKPRDSVENCVRVCSLLFLVLHISYAGGQLYGDRMAHHLFQAMTTDVSGGGGGGGDGISYNSGDSEIGRHFMPLPDLMLWCLCTGAMPRSRHRPFFISQLLSLLSRQGIPITESVLSHKLSPYLYLAERQSEMLSEVVRELHACTGGRGV